MSQEHGQGEQQKPAIPDSELIDGLKEDPNYFAVKYNERRQETAEAEKAASIAKIEAEKDTVETAKTQPGLRLTPLPLLASRTGGVYVPPHKLRRMQEEMMKSAENSDEQKQRIKWEMLRKSINEIINKVNVANIQNVIIELLNENIMRGMGLVARAVIKGQMASPNFTHVYAAVVSVMNTKLPDIGHLIIRRVILQFRRAYQRNNKIVCGATTKFLAHLINQKVLSDLFGLELLIFLLEEPTEDSVDIACDFMKECGQVLTELTPGGVNAIFERFKGILHEGETDRKVQYSIENLFAIRKNKFKDYPGVIPELDLVDEEDQITHNTELDAEITGEEQLNIFRLDPFFDKTEDEWRQIRLSILGEDNILKLKTSAMQLEDADDDGEPEPQIVDFTEDDMLKLRETIYLVIMNSIDFEECAHKLMKLNIGRGHEEVLSKMIVDCCVQERTYLKFYGLLAQRFCSIDDIYKKFFFRLFVDNYTVVHRFTTAKIRNLAKVFSHLLLTDALDWHVLRCVTLTDEATTASSRIFLKILFQDLAENMGLKTLCQRLHDSDMKEYFVGLFPTDHPQNARFAANFFGLIGLDAVAQPLKESLTTGMMADDTERLLMELAAVTSSSDSSDTSSSDDSSEESSHGSSKKRKTQATVKDESNGKHPPETEKGVIRASTTVQDQPKIRKGHHKERKTSDSDKSKLKAREETTIKRGDIDNAETANKKNRLPKVRDRRAPKTDQDKNPLKLKNRARSESSKSQDKMNNKQRGAEKLKKLYKEDKHTKPERSRSREKQKLKFKARRDSTESLKPKRTDNKFAKEKSHKPKRPSKSSSSCSSSKSGSSKSPPAKTRGAKIRHSRRNKDTSSDSSTRKAPAKVTKERKSRSRTKEKSIKEVSKTHKTEKIKMKRVRDSSSAEVNPKSLKIRENDKKDGAKEKTDANKKPHNYDQAGGKTKSKRKRSSSSSSSSSSSLSSSTDSNSSSSN